MSGELTAHLTEVCSEFDHIGELAAPFIEV